MSQCTQSILADIQTAQHAAGNAPTPLKSLATAISRRVDAAQTFRSSTPPRADLAEQYEREAAILREFVPQKSADALSKDQIEKLVKEVLVANELKKAVGKDTGRIIACVRVHTLWPLLALTLWCTAGSCGNKQATGQKPRTSRRRSSLSSCHEIEGRTGTKTAGRWSTWAGTNA